MVHRCCVPNCKNTNEKTKLHRFPISDEEVFYMWLQRCGNKKLQNLDMNAVNKSYRICHDHFSEKCYVPFGYSRTCLKERSLPTLNLPDISEEDAQIWNMNQITSLYLGDIDFSAWRKKNEVQHSTPREYNNRRSFHGEDSRATSSSSKTSDSSTNTDMNIETLAHEHSCETETNDCSDDTVMCDDDNHDSETATIIFPDGSEKKIESTCRLCLLESANLFPIFSAEDENEASSLHSTLMNFIPVQISDENDNLPKQVCESCYAQLFSWYNFCEMCSTTQTILKQFVKNICHTSKKKENLKRKAEDDLGRYQKLHATDPIPVSKKQTSNNTENRAQTVPQAGTILNKKQKTLHSLADMDTMVVVKVENEPLCLLNIQEDNSIHSTMDTNLSNKRTSRDSSTFRTTPETENVRKLTSCSIVRSNLILGNNTHSISRIKQNLENVEYSAGSNLTRINNT